MREGQEVNRVGAPLTGRDISSREVPMQLDALRELAHRNLMMIVELNNRLVPVLTPPYPQETAENKNGCSTEVGSALREVQSIIAEAINATESMIQRLEL